jgi:hypothetical protein
MANAARRTMNRRTLIQSGVLAASGVVFSRRIFGADVQGADGGQSWTLGNERIARMIAFRPGSGLTTTGITDHATQTEYIGKGTGHEFSFVCDGHTCA